jgi:hypothetical protein
MREADKFMPLLWPYPRLCEGLNISQPRPVTGIASFYSDTNMELKHIVYDSLRRMTIITVVIELWAFVSTMVKFQVEKKRNCPTCCEPLASYERSVSVQLKALRAILVRSCSALLLTYLRVCVRLRVVVSPYAWEWLYLSALECACVMLK